MFVKYNTDMRSLNIFLLLTTSLFMFSLQAQTEDQIISGYVKYIGGKKNWSKVKTIVTSGEYNYGGAAFPFTTTAKAPNRYKFVVPFNGKYYAQAFDGTNGWKIDAFKGETEPTYLTGKPALAMANEADVELQDPMIDYQVKGHQVLLEGKETIENTECFKIKFTRKNGDMETWYFDTKSHALVMKNAISKNVEMEGALFNTYYSNYKKVDGLKIPFKTVSKSNGQTILTITIDKVELNKSVADSEFQSK